ncbi:MAG: cupredoxin domain-containing protein [Omnitrophica bacterium]|nr:cupredoxin domain-containing protein [Candidatus Omnitrophota bacterium]
MSRNEIVAVILIILATLGTIFGVFAIEKFRLSKFYTLQLIARAPEHGNWYPQEFTVSYGKEVKLLIRNIETVTHGFAIPDLGVAVSEIKAGEVKALSFRPDKRGTFPFMCTVWCSDRHMEMRGKITVE